MEDALQARLKALRQRHLDEEKTTSTQQISIPQASISQPLQTSEPLNLPSTPKQLSTPSSQVATVNTNTTTTAAANTSSAAGRDVKGKEDADLAARFRNLTPTITPGSVQPASLQGPEREYGGMNEEEGEGDRGRGHGREKE